MRRYNYSCEENGIQYDNTYVYPGLKRPNNIYEAHWGDDPKAWINRINYDPETMKKNTTKPNGKTRRIQKLSMVAQTYDLAINRKESKYYNK